MNNTDNTKLKQMIEQAWPVPMQPMGSRERFAQKLSASRQSSHRHWIWGIGASVMGVAATIIAIFFMLQPNANAPADDAFAGLNVHTGIASVQNGKFNIKSCGYLNLSPKHSSGTIGFANMLNLLPKNSDNVRVDNAEYINLQGEHSKVQIGKVNDIKIDSRYNRVKIDEVNSSATLNRMEHTTVQIDKLNGRYDASFVKHSSLNLTLSKNYRNPNICLRENAFTDVNISIPRDLKVSCLLKAQYAKIKYKLHPSVKQYEIEGDSNDFVNSTHILLNTKTFTPTSVIDVFNNAHGDIVISSY